MPLPMVHLNIASLLANKWHVGEHQGAFYLGNIAPDSIHMRDGATREDKRHTHFEPKAEGDYMARLQERYSTLVEQTNDEGRKWFVRGYFMHVLTDYIWFRSVHPQFVKEVTGLERDEGMTQARDQLNRLYYQETDQVDFDLYQQAEWSSEVWQWLGRTRGYDMQDLLIADEMERWRDRTLSFLKEGSQQPGIVPQYITAEIVERFVSETAKRLQAVLQAWDARIPLLEQTS